jgi:hypothetical protein
VSLVGNTQTGGADALTAIIQADTTALLIKYEQIARSNRPDWADYITDAKSDPEGIAYEVAECSDAPMSGDAFDEVFTATVAWVDALSDDEEVCPDCGDRTFWSELTMTHHHVDAMAPCFLADTRAVAS